ncbi:class I SAM-dependent methyltransferase [Brevibacillus laterosporus]|uniref:class I SAM-dependent methyltransferase n=1 Tax=Brevibacillus laterosporus TaxID=1465 RepID=UPI00264B89FA|nr:class I SAM-dependent methyltransferase [Brevibacillus laterosporus]MDN9008749.1 methyltransferase domain-containing protein [Brevibacillus laterosporus]MDO0940856.1 methyltransferase domain-containing protein [Brevibacillus laterosporus]
MSTHFHNPLLKEAYMAREATDSWIDKMLEVIQPKGLQVLDAGCGGGIYTRAWAELGANQVTAMDFSEVMLSAAQKECSSYPQIVYHLGDVRKTDLPTGTYDLIYSRATIHHFTEWVTCFAELNRILNETGTCIIQDRTLMDCLLPGSPAHLRGYLFEFFPELKSVEEQRRPSAEAIKEALLQAGFGSVQIEDFWEVRRTYSSLQEYQQDLLERKGRSILHAISNEQLENYVNQLQYRLPGDQLLEERDRWTLWIARK